MTLFEIIGPKDGHSKMTNRIKHPVQPKSKFFTKFEKSDRKEKFFLLFGYTDFLGESRKALKRAL